ncbi:hypothetical protein FH972_026097 [Carpinus fangiana]|uniref:RNA helicase n=1 Tax=Carpinus fangiana TaxID=176857 RepID=A0A5N6L5K4_9ROSI|nr:hypothetical protein FH972_026097 [Carpinus fangiana]
MDDLAELERLSLVSKLASEIENHLGISSKDLAEYVIAQHKEASSLADFKTTFAEQGFPASLIESIDRLILTLDPDRKKAANKEADIEGSGADDKQSRIFKGLAIPDKQPSWAKGNGNGPTGVDAVDDTMAMLEGMAGARPKAADNTMSMLEGMAPTAKNNGQHNNGGEQRERRRDYDRRRDDDRDRRSDRDRHGRRHNDRKRSRSPGYDKHHSTRSRYEEPPIPARMPPSFQERGRGRGGRGFDYRNGNGGRGGYGGYEPEVPVVESGAKPRRNKKRLTSPERFEIQQLIASGAASAKDFPDYEEQYQAAVNGEGMMEEEEDVDIEVRDEEPPFLAGQTKQSLELSPIRVIKAPDGSMNRAAMSGDALAKERRDLRQQEARDKAEQEAGKVDLQAQWQDPMAGPGERQFASDLRNARGAPQSGARAEWRQQQTQKKELGKRTSMTIKEQRESLPVFKFRDSLLKAVHENPLLVVVGDTGSGKTTQLTQYLAEGGFGNNGLIGCTQPRRVAAVSVAKRVAEEVGCQLGKEIGYTIRFEDNTSPETVIKYMTDGIMQREILLDPELKKYSVIMLDEAHERTIATDVLFCLLKKALKRRPDLKVIVTSATLDAEKFSKYFNECPIFSIPGRTFPVEIMYSREPETDYLDAALVTAMQIHLTEPPGDILLFLTGKEEIDTSCEILYERMKALGPSVPELLILPIYSSLPSEAQSQVFEPAPSGARKLVIATNIAETSITIDGIYYVIDPGFVKQQAYDAKLGMDRLQVTPISQAQAKQRAGRAGRTGPGKCFRLYTEAAYQSEMLPTTIPEIQRQNLSNTILMLKAMGINDLLHFDFMDPPPTNTMLTALEELYALSALDDEGLLTRLGRQMADFPMEPALAKTLITSAAMQCSDEMLSIVAMISTQGEIFSRPRAEQQKADQKKARFHDPAGDHLTLLNAYQGYKGANYDFGWCRENFIQARSMKRARDVRDQLITILQRHRLPIVSCGRDSTRVRQALCAGYFRNAARKDPTEGFKTLVEGTPVYMHPSSALFGKAAEHVIYHSLVETTKEYMHQVTVIEPKWLVEAAPTFFKVAPTDRLSKRKKQERIQPLHSKFADADAWRLSAQTRPGKGGGGGTWG